MVWPCRGARARSGGRGWDASAYLLLSMVVASASDVGVPDRLAFRGLLRIGLVEPMLQDRDDGAVALRTDIVAAVARGFDPFRAVALLHSLDSVTAADALLPVRLSFRSLPHHPNHCLP